MEDYGPLCHEAFLKLVDWFGGNKAQLARTIGVSRNVISKWTGKRRIGRLGAMLVDAHPDIPFTKEQLRPDIKMWDCYKKPKGIQA